MCLNFWKICKNDWTSLCLWNNSVWLTQHPSEWFFRISKISPMELSRAFSELSGALSVVSLFIWQLLILHKNHLKLLHTSPNHWLLIRKLSFGYLWCTGERFLELTSAIERKPLTFICLNFSKFANSVEITWKFSKMIEPVFLYEKTQFGLPSTHLSAFAECPRFHLWSIQGLYLWYVCSLSNSSYCIKITWNFAHITEWLAFDQRTKFLPFVMHCRKVPRVDPCMKHFTSLFYLPEFLKVCRFSQNDLKLCKNDCTSLCLWKNSVWLTQHTS